MTAPSKLVLALALAGTRWLHPAAPPNPLFVEDRLFVTDGWSQPAYYDVTNDAFYQLGGVPPAAPVTTDANVGAGQFATGTAFTYRMTYYNSRIDVETPPVEYAWVVGAGGPNNVQHAFANPNLVDAQYDNVRFYRQLPGGNFKLVATVAGAAATYIDATTNTTLEGANPMILRLRTTLPPKFRGWVFAQGRIVAWTGTSAILNFSQLRSVGGLGNLLTDFPSDLILPIDPNDGYGVIVAVVFDGEAFYVFKEQAIYRVYGGPDPSDMDIEIVCAGWGCIAPGSVVRIKSVIFFLDETGPMMLPPGGSPQTAAQTDTGASPLEPVWERVNRRALLYVKAWHDVRRGRYVLRIPLDDDAVNGHAAVLEYRVPSERYVAVDEEVYLGPCATFKDGGGIVHSMGLDDLGNVIEIEYGSNDLLPSGASAAATTVAGGSSRNLVTDGAYAGTWLGVPFELRDAAGAVVSRNRLLSAAGINAVPLYHFSAAVAAAQKVYPATIRGFIQTKDENAGKLREEKDVDSVGVQHLVATGSLGVTVVQDGLVSTSLDAVDLAKVDGSSFCHGKGTRGRRIGIRLENANADEPWAVSGVDVEFGESRVRT